MKRFLIFLSISLFALVGMTSPTQEVSGLTGAITWSYDDYLITGTVDLLPGIKSVTFELPNGDPAYTYYDVKNTYDEYFNVTFYDDDETPADEFVLFDTLDDNGSVTPPWIINQSPTGTGSTESVTTYFIYLESYDVPDTVDRMIIEIPVTGVPSPAGSDAFINQLENTCNYSYSYDSMPYGRFAMAITRPTLPNDGTTTQTHEIKSQFIEVPEGTGIIEYYVGWGFALGSQNDYFPYVEYYDEDKNLLFTDLQGNDSTDDYFHDWFPYKEITDPKHSVFQVAWDFWNFDEPPYPVKYIRYVFYDSANAYMFINMYDYIYSSVYYFDQDFITVNFYVDGEIEQQEFVNVGNYADWSGFNPTSTGKEFVHWIDANGNVWEDGTSITSDMILNNTANIYAVFSDDGTAVNPGADDPTPDAGNFEYLLTDMGFNDANERVIVFALVLIVITILMLAKGVAMFNILIVDGIVTAFFITLGLLPAFVSIIIVVILLFLGYRYVMGGGAHE